MRLPNRPDNCPRHYWVFERMAMPGGRREALRLDCAGAPGALVVFTTGAAARRFQDSCLGADWMLEAMTGHLMTEALGGWQDLGAAHVAIDPEPGLKNRAVRILEAICRLC